MQYRSLNKKAVKQIEYQTKQEIHQDKINWQKQNMINQ